MLIFCKITNFNVIIRVEVKLMKNNSKTLTIETKKLWIIGGILSLLASIYPSILLVLATLSDVDKHFIKDEFLPIVIKWAFPSFVVIFFLFVVVFILLCKWQSKKVDNLK